MAQSASVKIIRKINEAKKYLIGKNVPGCLLQFKTALEIATSENILAADKKAVQEAIEKLQGEIQGNPSFKEIFGPVTFSGSEFDVALAFVKQLIQASSEELFESTTLYSEKNPEGEEDQDDQSVDEAGDSAIDNASDESALFRAAMEQAEAGNLATVKDMIGQDEDLLDRVIDKLNEQGIAHRSSGDYENAILCYSRGLQLRPDDEGLYYNMARACYERGDATDALNYLEEALMINPEFSTGKNLQNFIRSKGTPS